MRPAQGPERGCPDPLIGPRVRRYRVVPAGAPRVGGGPGLRAEEHLAGLLADLAPLTTSGTTPGGLPYRVSEVLLVNDCGPDDSAGVMRTLEREHPWVRTVWLSRNFGRHAATLAGMASSGGDWIVTMDEDGQHDPADIPTLLDVAMAEQVSVVYARPVNAPPHGLLRNTASYGASARSGWSASVASTRDFHAYR